MAAQYRVTHVNNDYYLVLILEEDTFKDNVTNVTFTQLERLKQRAV